MTPARDRLLDATAELIIERESIDIPLADIATRSGLNAALVKYYFGAKDGLFQALLRRDAERALEQMHLLLAMKADAATKMRLHLRGIMRAYRRSPYLNRLLHALLNGRDAVVVGEMHALIVRPVVECQRQILKQGAASGEFRAVDPMLFYISAVGACDQFMHGDRIFALTTGERAPEDFQDRAMRFVEDMVLACLRPDTCEGALS